MNILERMAVKECYYWSSLAWRDPREWRDKLPREIAYMNRLKATGCTEHIINHKGHRLIMHQQRLRIYLDFCDYGSLLSVLRRFPLENGKANQSKEKEGKSLATWKKKVTVEKELPEAWIWHCFYAMVDACLVMRDGTRGAKQGDWREIIHCDFKPENVLITPPRAEEGTTKTGKEKVKAVQEGSEMPLVQRPNWPKVAVTDFGCAFDDGPDNPREYIEDGTFHMRPPVSTTDWHWLDLVAK
ncbi:hypothetical protein BU16DRAFT_7398 [Lophium mytilinum]|uniref:Protein kinase domain-containing protein n=1 Tax=Lophium mytilinum TaxID=390894 RepID=A0A6A6RD61_9PEZI|nr:hypothetical protein BU16DRAFT_7398 [Lophium mytilinum]